MAHLITIQTWPRYYKLLISDHNMEQTNYTLNASAFVLMAGQCKLRLLCTMQSSRCQNSVTKHFEVSRLTPLTKKLNIHNPTCVCKHFYFILCPQICIWNFFLLTALADIIWWPKTCQLLHTKHTK